MLCNINRDMVCEDDEKTFYFETDEECYASFEKVNSLKINGVEYFLTGIMWEDFGKDEKTWYIYK